MMYKIIVAAKSPLLKDVFSLEEIIALETNQGETDFQRLNAEEFDNRLDGRIAKEEL